MGKNIRDKFILLKKIGKHKKGEVFESFGGLVSGITVEIDGIEQTIRFDNPEYFRLK
jgi:hypothetical protein